VVILIKWNNLIRCLASLGENINIPDKEFPEAYDISFLKTGVHMMSWYFYHMWQAITEEQAEQFADCIRQGKRWWHCITVSVHTMTAGILEHNRRKILS